jgi:hypothetical protein
MFVSAFISYPEERKYKHTYVEVFKKPTKLEVTSIIKEYGCGRYGIVNGEVWFWRGDVFHSTIMQELWNLRIYKQWLDWDEKLYFERDGEGVIWSTKPHFEAEEYLEEIKTMQYSYLRMKEIRSGTTFKALWRKHEHIH